MTISDLADPLGRIALLRFVEAVARVPRCAVPKAIVALGLAIGSHTALAQLHVCNGTPGERQVGFSASGHGVGSVPLCAIDPVQESEEAQSQSPRRMFNTYGALVTDDTTGVLSAAIHFDRAEDALSAAREECGRRSGRIEDCRSLLEVSNQCFSAAVSETGGRYAHSHLTKDFAETLAVRGCTRAAGTRCRAVLSACSPPVDEVFARSADARWPTVWSISPPYPGVSRRDGDRIRSTFVALAAEVSGPRSWGLSSGLFSRQEAKAAAMEACTRMGATRCGVLAAVQDECISVATGGLGRHGGIGKDARESQQRAVEGCEERSEGHPCTVAKTVCSERLRVEG